MAKTTKMNGKKLNPDEKTVREMVEKKAYEIYEKRGAEHGRDIDDWIEAERLIMKDLGGK